MLDPGSASSSSDHCDNFRLLHFQPFYCSLKHLPTCKMQSRPRKTPWGDTRPAWDHHSLTHSELVDIYSLQSTCGTVGGTNTQGYPWRPGENTQTLPRRLCPISPRSTVPEFMRQFKIFFSFVSKYSSLTPQYRSERKNKGNAFQVSGLLVWLCPRADK